MNGCIFQLFIIHFYFFQYAQTIKIFRYLSGDSSFIIHHSLFMLMRKVFFAWILSSITMLAVAQTRVSILNDLSIVRNFSPQQQFWAFGHGISANFHFTNRESVYTSFLYYTEGSFRNNYSAVARDASTDPAVLNYRVRGGWTMRQASLGWKHFFKGGFDTETGWNIYTNIGVGVMFTRINNREEPAVDTALYLKGPAPEIGERAITRLNIDLAGGIEYPMGGNFFLYGELRTWIKTSSKYSPYLHNNEKVPMPVMIHGGLRILFGY